MFKIRAVEKIVDQYDNELHTSEIYTQRKMLNTQNSRNQDRIFSVNETIEFIDLYLFFEFFQKLVLSIEIKIIK